MFALAVVLSTAACSGDDVNYYGHIAPIISKNCLGCHVSGGIGPFSLETHAAVKANAQLVAYATGARIMPPVKVDASGACNTYSDTAWLTDEEISMIQQWADAESPKGEPDEAAPIPPPNITDMRTDLIRDMPVPYTADGALTDDYRCFVIDPGLTTDKILTAFRVNPGDRELVHHVIVYGMTTAAADAQAEQRDADEPGPGYSCFGGPRVGSFGGGGTGGNLSAGFTGLAGWAPGGDVTRYPAGTGIRMYAGRKIVMQVHYNLLAGVRPDVTSFEMELEDCRSEVNGFCFSPQEAFIAPPGVFNLNLPPGQPSVAATNSFLMNDYFGLPLKFWMVNPHMHKVGKTMTVNRVLPNGDKQCVMHVPDWDFNWQRYYTFENPVIFDPTDRIEVTCTYDTMGQDQMITFGEGTEDEMCFAFFYVTI